MDKTEQANALHSFSKYIYIIIYLSSMKLRRLFLSWIKNYLTDKKQRAGENCSGQKLQIEISPSDCPNPIVFISDLKKRIQLTLSSSGDSEISNWQEQNGKKNT